MNVFLSTSIYLRLHMNYFIPFLSVCINDPSMVSFFIITGEKFKGPEILSRVGLLRMSMDGRKNYNMNSVRLTFTV